MKNVFLFTILLVVIVGVAVACPPPTLPPGATWVSNANCTSGTNYEKLNPPRQRCRCWGRCGYICESTDATAATTAATTVTTVTTTTTPTTTTTTTKASTTKTTTAASTTVKASPCPYGGVWFNPKGQRCYCQSHNKQPYYVCEATTTTSSSSV